MYADRLLLAGDAQEGSNAFEYLAHSRQDVDGLDDREEWKTLTVSSLPSRSTYHFRLHGILLTRGGDP